MSNKEVADHPIDETMPDGSWKFDNSVTTVFDNMLERSIPQYNVMRDLTFDLVCKYQKDNTDIVDLGCSRGDAIAKVLEKFGAYNHYIGVDVSEPMLVAARERFAGYIRPKVVEIRNLDLRIDYPPASASVTLLVLTLMFTPINYRQKILANVYKHTINGGALILVEKLLGSSSSINDLMIDEYHQMKSKNGYTQEQIERKQLALEGVQVPVTAAWNEDLLRQAGFREIDCFWRWMNFGAFIAIK